MASTRQNVLLGLGFLTAGIVLALALNAQGADGEQDASNPKQSSRDTARRLAQLQHEPTPEKYQGAQNHLEDRWGHLGEVPEAAVSVDPSGDRYLLLPDIFVGLGADGKKRYLRAIARSRTSDKLEKMDFSDKIDQFPVVKAPNYQPPPILSRLRNMDGRIEPGEELPDELGGGTSEGAWKLPPAAGGSN